MIYQATEAISQFLDEKGVHYRVSEDDNSSRVIVTFECDNTDVTVQFISSDDDSDVAARVYRLVRFPEEKFPRILEAVNGLNRRFRFARFVADPEDRSVDLHYDFPICTDNVGEVAHEILSRLVDIGDKAFPELMKATYGD